MDKLQLHQSMKDVVNYFNQYDPTLCKMRLCLDLTLYLRGSIGEHREPLLHFYRKSMELMGEKVTYCLPDLTNKFKKRRKNSLDILPNWLERGDKEGFALLTLLCDSQRDSMSEYSFSLEMSEDKSFAGFVRSTLPIDSILNSVDEYVEFCIDATRDLDFLHGHAGFGALTREISFIEEGPHELALSRRYLGIDFGRPSSINRFIGDNIKCINWLTFINNDLVERVNSSGAMEGRFGDAATVHRLKHGVMIRAGNEPIFGDVSKREALTHYQAVGKVLSPVRMTAEEYGRWNVGDADNTASWLARFD